MLLWSWQEQAKIVFLTNFCEFPASIFGSKFLLLVRTVILIIQTEKHCPIKDNNSARSAILQMIHIFM